MRRDVPVAQKSEYGFAVSMAGITSLHGKTFLASLILVLCGGALVWQAQNRTTGSAIDLTVEHDAPFGLTLSLSTQGETRFVEIGNESADTVHVSLPEAWERREVRNVPLLSIASSEPSHGSIRWTLPAGAFVSYRSETPWSQLVVRNPSKIPFKINLAIINLETLETERDIILVKDKPVVIR
jgi:hypothetical protein